MAKDWREELIRKAVANSLGLIRRDVATTLSGNNKIKDEAVIAPVVKVINTSVASPVEFSAPSPSSDKYAAPENASSIEIFPQASAQSLLFKKRPQRIEETPKTTDIFSPQQSSIAGPSPKKQPATYRPEGPVGIDIGTTSIVIAEGRKKTIHSIKQTKFSTSFPLDSYTKNVLAGHEVPCFELSNLAYLQGYATETIGNSFRDDPLWQYLKDAKQGQEGLCLIEGILQNLLGHPKIPATPLYFSVPGESLENGNNLSFHTGIIQSYLEGLGYSAKPINEGLAVVMAELADNDFTGIGVSIGASMCHICLAYLSISVVSFSISKAGDYIDKQVSACTGELLYNVKEAKENDFSLAAKPANHIDRALRIYYDDVVQDVVTAMKTKFRNVDLPMHDPIPLVFSGGVMKTKGLLEAFEKVLSTVKLPVRFSRIQQANDPLTSVARGALAKAMFEES